MFNFDNHETNEDIREAVRNPKMRSQVMAHYGSRLSEGGMQMNEMLRALRILAIMAEDDKLAALSDSAMRRSLRLATSVGRLAVYCGELMGVEIPAEITDGCKEPTDEELMFPFGRRLAKASPDDLEDAVRDAAEDDDGPPMDIDSFLNGI